MISIIYWSLLRTIVWVASFTPLNRRRIVFCSYGGRGIGSDPGAIIRYLARGYADLDLVWMVKDYASEVPSRVRKVRIFNQGKSILGQIITLFRSAATFSSAKVIVCDSKNNLFLKNRKSLYIQTWHGDLPFKYIEGECIASLGKEFERVSSADSKRTDVILSGSSFMSEIFRHYFWLPKQCRILEKGLPRNDIYFDADGDVSGEVRRFYGIPDSFAVAVYAPTFRDNGDVSVFNALDFSRVRAALQQRFAREWKILVRMHPNVDAKKVAVQYDENVIDVSWYPCGESVFKAAEVLITDASSVVREFMMMRKPIFLYFPDYVQYVKSCRALRPLFFDLPFRRCGSNSELIEEILGFDEKSSLERMDEFLHRNNIRFFDDGHATEMVVDMIIKFVSGER